jgi:hypothetical protein
MADIFLRVFRLLKVVSSFAAIQSLWHVYSIHILLDPIDLWTRKTESRSHLIYGSIGG